ncbi:outer membrane protein assembly factor [Salinibacter grassmerensis]|uniref:outer membrane protein assembly factor n=1 Tax=Salinibacter grassmerensis TaxID=3040353 RepID=UPI0021E72454|nr:outer membrane protein assembly factor [Salinibacter grassmerensis]
MLRRRSGARPVLALLLGGMIGLVAAPAAGQAFPGAPDEPGTNLRVYPLATWSPRVGVGAGAGLVVHHLGRRHAQALLAAAPAQHEQVATAAWASANPDRARQYVLVSARGLHTNRDWFYGLGPGSSSDARQPIERSAVQVRVRAGQYFLDRRLLLQPHVGLSTHRVDRVLSPADPRLDEASRQHLRQLASSRIGPLSPSHTGLRVGVDVRYDTRSPRPRPTRGVLLNGGWERYGSLSSSFVQYDRLDLSARGLVPLGGAHHLAGQLSLAHTVVRGEASVPYYLRPMLDGTRVPGLARHRFVGSDRLIGSVLYRFPLVQPLGVVRLGGHVGLHAASVYDDVFSDAALDVAFDDAAAVSDTSVPLRPAASIGLRMGLSFREVPSLDLALGISPEGVTGVRFALQQDLQALRPPLHQLRQP